MQFRELFRLPPSGAAGIVKDREATNLLRSGTQNRVHMKSRLVSSVAVAGYDPAGAMRTAYSISKIPTPSLDRNAHSGVISGVALLTLSSGGFGCAP
jgi:hypothetical protein